MLVQKKTKKMRTEESTNIRKIKNLESLKSAGRIRTDKRFAEDSMKMKKNLIL